MKPSISSSRCASASSSDTSIDMSEIGFFTAFMAHNRVHFPRTLIMNKVFSYHDTYRVESLIPNIVVIGNEISGKSILLERLLHIPIFPSDRATRTQLPIKFHLRNSQIQSLRFVIIEQDQPIFSFESEDMCEFSTQIRTKMQELNGELSLNKEFRITYCRPDAPNLNIIDMPGFNAQRKDDITEYLEQYTKSNTLFITVVSAMLPVNQSMAIEFLMTYDMLQNTIIVISRCDMYQPEFADTDDDRWAALSNKIISERSLFTTTKGIVLISSRNKPCANDWVRIDNMITRENEFFLETGTHLQQYIIGIDKLREKIIQMVDEWYVCDWRRSIEHQLRTKMIDASEDKRREKVQEMVQQMIQRIQQDESSFQNWITQLIARNNENVAALKAVAGHETAPIFSHHPMRTRIFCMTYEPKYHSIMDDPMWFMPYDHIYLMDISTTPEMPEIFTKPFIEILNTTNHRRLVFPYRNQMMKCHVSVQLKQHMIDRSNLLHLRLMQFIQQDTTLHSTNFTRYMSEFTIADWVQREYTCKIPPFNFDANTTGNATTYANYMYSHSVSGAYSNTGNYSASVILRKLIRYTVSPTAIVPTPSTQPIIQRSRKSSASSSVTSAATGSIEGAAAGATPSQIAMTDSVTTKSASRYVNVCHAGFFDNNIAATMPQKEIRSISVPIQFTIQSPHTMTLQDRIFTGREFDSIDFKVFNLEHYAYYLWYRVITNPESSYWTNYIHKYMIDHPPTEYMEYDQALRSLNTLFT
jgi:hypothetical protein